MNFKQFMEMALKSYNVGPFVKPNSNKISMFNRADIKTLQLPKTYNQLEVALKRSTKHDFNIIIGQPPIRDVGTKKFRDWVLETIQQKGIKTENHITFAKKASTGGALTAWMILHNIAHALLDYSNPGEKDIIVSLLGKLETTLNVDEKSRIKDLSQLFKFRSARISQKDMTHPHAIDRMEELAFELFADYLWHGHIRISQRVPVIVQIEKIFQQCLHGAVGTIVYDLD